MSARDSLAHPEANGGGAAGPPCPEQATATGAEGEDHAGRPKSGKPTSGVHLQATSEQPRVLVIDDEPAIGRVIERLLGRDYQVEAVLGVDDALERIANSETPFDVILCDLNMPGRSGIDLLFTLVQIAPEQAERVIFLTGGACDAASERFLDAVPNEWILKPFEAASMRHVVERAVFRVREMSGP